MENSVEIYYPGFPREILVDIEDVPRVLGQRLHLANGYIMQQNKDSLAKGILQCFGFYQIVDHENRNIFDNRKSNLRRCTRQQNNCNRIKQTTRAKKASQYKGVFWEKANSKWRVQIDHKGNRTHVGCFVNEIEAAKAYDKAAIEKHGQFAYVNFPVVTKGGV